MSTWYQINYYAGTISPVEVVKETQEFITLAAGTDGYDRELKRRKGTEFAPTFAEARQSLMKHFSDDITRYERAAERCRGLLNKAFLLEEAK